MNTVPEEIQELKRIAQQQYGETQRQRLEELDKTLAEARARFRAEEAKHADVATMSMRIDLMERQAKMAIAMLNTGAVRGGDTAPFVEAIGAFMGLKIED